MIAVVVTPDGGGGTKVLEVVGIAALVEETDGEVEGGVGVLEGVMIEVYVVMIVEIELVV